MTIDFNINDSEDFETEELPVDTQKKSFSYKDAVDYIEMAFDGISDKVEKEYATTFIFGTNEQIFMIDNVALYLDLITVRKKNDDCDSINASLSCIGSTFAVSLTVVPLEESCTLSMTSSLREIYLKNPEKSKEFKDFISRLKKLYYYE